MFLLSTVWFSHTFFIYIYYLIGVVFSSGTVVGSTADAENEVHSVESPELTNLVFSI